MNYIQRRLAAVAQDLEAISEDAASDADNGELDVRVTEAIEEALNAIERARTLAT